MRKFKNKFAAIAAAAMTGVMAFGLVATAAPVVSVYAEGEGDTTTTPSGDSAVTAKVDYENMILTVSTSDPYFTVDVLKTESDKEKPSKTYTYAGGEGVKIDLGFLKIKKENILNIYGSSQTDKSKGSIVKIAAQPVKEKFTVDATKDSLLEALGKTEADKDTYEWRSSFGSNWGDLDTFNFASAKVAGTTIVVRQAAVVEEGKETPAGPEAKIKVPAAPKAPKVTVDYVKDSVKVTDKMQIALLGENPVDEETGWVDAGKGMTRAQIVTALKISDEDAAKAFSIVVRTKANGKKSASMPVIVPIKATSVLTASSETAPDSATVSVGDATVTIKADKTENGVTFTISGGTATFQYDKGSDKWANITSGTEIKTSASTIKVRIAPEKEDKKVAGSGAFASNVVTLTPAVEEASPTPSTGATE